jgi:DNA-binding NarL/FixJ family response regulator
MSSRGARVRILLIDDHDLFREGLKYLLSVLDDKIQYFEAGSMDEALRFADDLPIDLILLDYYMPGVNGFDGLETCRARFEGAALVVLSGEEDPRVIRQSVEKGASGFIPKSSSREELVAALKLVLAGGTFLPKNAFRPARQMQACTGHDGDLDGDMVTRLSRRQFQVLMKAVLGKSNKVIAKELDISDHTVKAHLSVAFRTLGVQNRTEAVYATAKLGIRPGHIERFSEVTQQ